MQRYDRDIIHWYLFTTFTPGSYMTPELPAQSQPPNLRIIREACVIAGWALQTRGRRSRANLFLVARPTQLYYEGGNLPKVTDLPESLHSDLGVARQFAAGGLRLMTAAVH